MRLRLRSRANGTNGSAATNGHATRATLPDIRDLTAQVARTREQISALATERAELALASLIGDEHARQRIAEIDQERQQLVASLETIEAAIRTLQTEQRISGWRNRLDHFRRCTNGELIHVYAGFEVNIKNALLDRSTVGHNALTAVINELQDVELATAKRVIADLLPEVRVPYRQGDQADLIRARKEKEKLLQERAQQVQAAAQEIVSAGLLKRPQALLDAVELAQQRIAVGANPIQGMRAP